MQFASSLRSNPFVAVYVKERLSPSINRVTGYRVCQLILCHNNILKHIGEWPNSLDQRLPKLNSE